MKKTIWLMCFITLCATVLLFANKHITVYKPIQQAVDSLVVLKSKNSLQVYANKKLLKTYSCGIGSNRNGKKQCQGDNRTPEGKYYITARSDKSIYYKNLHINYPNTLDRKRCKAKGLNPGGDIKIHGYADQNGNTNYRNIKFSETWGCIGVTNAEMDELYKWVKDGAVIVLKE